MKIGLIIASLDGGGAERVASLLVSAWSAQGHDVTLITFSEATSDLYPVTKCVKRISLGGVPPRDTLWVRARCLLQRLLRLRRALKQTPLDLVVSFGDSTNLLTLAAALGLKLPVVVSERTDPRPRHLKTSASLVRRLLYPLASCVVMQSRAACQWAESIVSSHKIRVIPNPVLSPAITNSVAKQNRVIGLGRLGKEKGFDLLIRAFAQCSPAHSGWTLALFGKGPEQAALQSLARDCGIAGRVQFAGMTRQPAEELAASEIFVLPSRFEGFPNALLEAIACGVACISFDCPSGPGEIIRDGDNGLLIPPGDVGRLAIALNELMSDPDRRSRLGAGARDVLDRYALDQVSQTWSALFAEIVR